MAWFFASAARRCSCVEPGRHQLAVFLLESRFLRGRHVAEIEPIEHVAPVVAIVALDEIGIELVDPQLPLGFGRAVTTVTVLLKERGHAREGNGLVRTKRRRFDGREHGDQREHPSRYESARWGHGKRSRMRVVGQATDERLGGGSQGRNADSLHGTQRRNAMEIRNSDVAMQSKFGRGLTGAETRLRC